MQSKKLGRREPIIKAKMLRQKPDFAAHLHVGRGCPQHESLTARRFNEPQKHFDRSAFAGAVGSEETEDRSALNGEREIADRDLGAVNLAQILRSNGEVIQMSQCLSSFYFSESASATASLEFPNPVSELTNPFFAQSSV